MQTKTKAGRYSLLFFFLVLLFTACNSNSEEKKDEKEMSAEPPPKTNALTAGPLDTLYIERKAFDDLQGTPKLIFSFVFTHADSLTLHGWLYKPNFDPLPNMKLKCFSRDVQHSYGIGTYFGNVVLQSTDITRIRQALTPEMNYVLFAPKLDGSHLKYEILVTDKLRVSKDAMLVVTATGADANPSPPKTY